MGHVRMGGEMHEICLMERDNVWTMLNSGHEVINK